jgi:anaerobic magnesium-protoporphyrin IX monomethyl ester cyclase
MPPLNLAVLYSYLKKQDINLNVLDLNIECFHKSIEDIKKTWICPDKGLELNSYIKEKFNDYLKQELDNVYVGEETYYCFSVFNANKEISLYLAEYLKKKYKSAKIIFGGPEVLYEYNKGNEFPFSDYADISIVGEGERPLIEIIQGSKEKVFVYSQDKKHETLIDFDCFPLNKYLRQGFLPVLMSKGCINKCAFCVECILRKGFVSRINCIITEIENYINKYGVKNFIFHDSLINGDLKALELFCDKVLEKKLNIHWEGQVYIRSDMSYDLMLKMKQAGCYNIFIGAESFSDKVLEYFNKGYKQADVLDFLKKLKQAGLHSELSLIVGAEAEGEKEFFETLDFIKQNKEYISKLAQVNELKQLPGTDLKVVEADISKKRVDMLVGVFEAEGIKYTKEFINNL